MTPEAALTKLAFLLSQDELTTQQVKDYIVKDLRGELTVRKDKLRFSFQEQLFVDTVAKVLSQGEQLGINEELSQAMFPVLMCSAAMRGDLEAIERMLQSNVSIDIGDYDGRTALHIASAEGHIEVVRFLLTKNANPMSEDRWGRSPLDDAKRGGHLNVEKLLLDYSPL